MKHQD